MSIFSMIGAMISDSPTAKGKRGEMMSGGFLSMGLNKNDGYVIFNDVTLHTSNNDTTQIDHVIISPFGVFVIEVKNYSGWIYGSENQYKWTQVLNKQSKNQFQNPLIQNKKHCQVVQKILELENRQIHSMVVFMGKATFKTEMPDNVMYLGDMNDYIRGFQKLVFNEKAYNKAIARLNNRKLSQGKVANSVHMGNIERKREQREEKKKQHQKNKAHQTKPINKNSTMSSSNRHSIDTNDRIVAETAVEMTTKIATEAIQAIQSIQEMHKPCPKCGSQLVKRKAKRGKNIGQEFYGCATFPKCRYVQNIL